ncbi:MAG: hypothetical protein KF830_12635 [Planctomycetes bacterium]|nr:hypothetical protein [Planctomycetota bacterium]
MSVRPPVIPGLRWLPSAVPDAVEGAFTPEAGAATVASLLAVIPRRGGLRFFDYLYHGEPPAQSPLDHGAVFFVYRRLRGDLFATCGNHGWTLPWTPVGAGELGGFLLGCLDSNRGHGARSQTLRLEPRASYVPRRSAVHPNPRLLLRRDAWQRWRGA